MGLPQVGQGDLSGFDNVPAPLPWKLILMGAGLIGSLLFKSGSRRPPPDAQGMALTENPSSPVRPWRMETPRR